MKLVNKGAEANLYLDSGKLVKERVTKKYRIPDLDKKLRQSRTRHETKLLKKLKELGVSVPVVLKDDENKNTIVMEFIDGVLVKVFLENANENDIKKISEKIGTLIAKMHSANIVHNDLTTSNMLLKDEKIFVIDLGLGFVSTRVEDKSMDLVVLKKALKATHPKKFETIWNGILAGYVAYPNHKEVVNRIEKIEKRARYT